MRLHHHQLDCLIAVFLRHISCGKEIAFGLAHFYIIHVNIAVVHPVMGIFLAGAAFALGNLVFMVREDQILSAAMDVDGLTQELADHRGAFDMPAGAAFAPRRLPIRLPFFCRFPQRKVHGVFFLFRHINSVAGVQLLDWHMG